MTKEELSEMCINDLAVTAVLPEEVNTFEYTRNHHFLRFRKRSGEETKVLPLAMCCYSCEQCDFQMFTEYNHGTLSCPVCKSYPMKSLWMKRQTCFVPEKESNFEWPSPEDKKSKG